MGSDDNFPTVIGRPVFDTEPCPLEIAAGPFHLTGTREEVAEQVRKLDEVYGGIAQWHPDFTGKDEAGNPVRVSANGRAAFPLGDGDPQIAINKREVAAVLMSPCGHVTVPEPTREALQDSACDWATMLSSEVCALHHAIRWGGDVVGQRAKVRMTGIRLDSVLAELAAMEAK